MEKTAKFNSGRLSGSNASGRAEERRSSERRRRIGHGEELRVELKLAKQQRRTLAITTVILFVAFVCLAAWALRQQSIFSATVNRKLEQIAGINEQLTAAKTALDESRLAVEALVHDRIPGLLPFRIDEPISVDTPFVRELSFKSAAPPTFGHECKLVVENDSSSPIRPALSVILFDDVGVQLGKAQLTDGILDELRVDEVRSFFATLEITQGSVPRYFLLTSD